MPLPLNGSGFISEMRLEVPEARRRRVGPRGSRRTVCMTGFVASCVDTLLGLNLPDFAQADMAQLKLTYFRSRSRSRLLQSLRYFGLD